LIGLSFRFSVFRPQERTKSTSLSPILVFRSRPGGGNEILLINLAPSRRRYSRILNVRTSELRNSLNVVNCLNDMKSPEKVNWRGRDRSPIDLRSDWKLNLSLFQQIVTIMVRVIFVVAVTEIANRVGPMAEP
jgi:hypothetical protein